MFNEIVIRRGIRRDGSFDAGLLAEALFFYERPLILLDRGSLLSMVESVGNEATLALLEEHQLKISYMQELFGTMSQTENGLKFHRFAEFKVSGPKQQRRDGHGEVEEVLTTALGRSRETRNFIKRLNEKTSIHRLRPKDSLGADTAQAANAELDDVNETEDKIKVVLSQLVPEYKIPRDFRFKILKIDSQSFIIDTNIEFIHLNRAFTGHYKNENNTITREFLVNHLYEARVDTYLCGHYMAPFVTSPIGHALMKKRLVELVARRSRDVNEIDLFQEFLPEGRKIREVINSGERSFAEFIELLNDAKRFKGWLRDKNPDQSLVAEYTTAITKLGWADKLPSKAMRWVFTTGLGATIDALYPTSFYASAAAQSISALDAMFLDRLLKGWKPDQFVTGELSEFARGASANPSSTGYSPAPREEH